MIMTLTVNGVNHTIDVDPSMPLLYALRNQLQMDGAKFGCGMGQCGACTVIVGDAPVFSCLLPVVAVDKRPIRTVEGLGTIEQPGPLQQAFIDQQAAQCGYCIAGMMMRAQALLDHNPAPSDAQIRAQLEPNLCRCGTHMRIIAAVHQAAQTMRQRSASTAVPNVDVGVSV
jgi:nicotinate dehydrogenase subunit A